LNYLRLTGRAEEQIALVEKYCKENSLWYDVDTPDPEFTDVIEINLSELEPSLSGPKRPQDLINLSDMKESFIEAITAPVGNKGFGLDESEFEKEVTVKHANGKKSKLKTGSLAIASITS